MLNRFFLFILRPLKPRSARSIAMACAVVLIIAIGPSRAELVDRILAIVNDDIILLSDYERFTAPYREQMKQAGQSDARIGIVMADQKNAILNKMIEEKLTDQQAKKNGINVGDAEVDAYLDRIRQGNGLSEDDLIRRLALDGLTLAQFRDQVREQILQGRLLNREVRAKIVITDEDVKAYYDANKAQYATKTDYHLRHILMKTPVNDPDDRAGVLQRMQQLHGRLEAGESFADLAKVYSQSPSADEGGDIGFFESRILAEPIRKALEGLKAGQFTQVLDTEQGYQIFFIQEVRRSGGKTLEEATPEIQDKLYGELVEKKFQSWLKELRDHSHIEILE